jgi:RNA polymerase sigma factor (sigma-70 family)
VNLSELFTNNYEYLNTVAKRITRCKNVRMAPDLLSETYINLSNKETHVPDDNEEFVKFFCKCMKNYFIWPNSSFNKLYESEAVELDDFKLARLTDPEAQREIEISVEQTNDFTKEIIEISSSMGKAKTLKYIELVEFKRDLPPHEQILFELYFEKELSTRKIASMYSDEAHKMNYQSINQFVNVIKRKIDNYQWKQ